MLEPISLSEAIQIFLDKAAVRMYGMSLSYARVTSVCVRCKEGQVKFETIARREEWYTTGLCKRCDDALEEMRDGKDRESNSSNR